MFEISMPEVQAGIDQARSAFRRSVGLIKIHTQRYTWALIITGSNVYWKSTMSLSRNYQQEAKSNKTGKKT